ncbi:MAG: hypothetical protein A2Z96_06010 [Spirochaetes bacterium GWB1_48_6]|nr:MAG: hypothetical protein A2Z96_06010 [Spirochaetes bacterium GWB1_48_6]
MLAVLINAFTVIIGTVLGVVIGPHVKEELKKLIMAAIGLTTLLIGLKMGMEGQYLLGILGCLLLGGVLGHWGRLEDRILGFGHFLRRRFATNEGSDGKFAHGFLNASLLFCVGAMTILGSLQAGIEGKYDIILIKSVMDGFMAFIMASTLGAGVGFSAISILLYQGALTLGAGFLQPWITPLLKTEINGLGGILVMAIGLELLELKKIKTAELLPSLILVVIFALTQPWWSGFFS